MIHKKKCACGHMLNVQDVYEQGRADAQKITDEIRNTEFINGMKFAFKFINEHNGYDYSVEEIDDVEIEKIVRIE